MWGEIPPGEIAINRVGDCRAPRDGRSAASFRRGKSWVIQVSDTSRSRLPPARPSGMEGVFVFVLSCYTFVRFCSFLFPFRSLIFSPVLAGSGKKRRNERTLGIGCAYQYMIRIGWRQKSCSAP